MVVSTNNLNGCRDNTSLLKRKNRWNRFWRKTGNLLIAELYTDFVPRWFKKEDRQSRDYDTESFISLLSPVVKFAIGVGLYPLLVMYNLGSYGTIIGGLSIYLGADGAYQLLDLRHPYQKELRKAATLAVDLLTYPFYLMTSEAQRGCMTK